MENVRYRKNLSENAEYLCVSISRCVHVCKGSDKEGRCWFLGSGEMKETKGNRDLWMRPENWGSGTRALLRLFSYFFFVHFLISATCLKIWSLKVHRNTRHLEKALACVQRDWWKNLFSELIDTLATRDNILNLIDKDAQRFRFHASCTWTSFPLGPINGTVRSIWSQKPPVLKPGCLELYRNAGMFWSRGML